MTDTERRAVLIAAFITAFLLGFTIPWEVMPWNQ